MVVRQIHHKSLFRLMVPSLKWIIILIGLMYVLNIVLCYMESPMEILSYLGGLSVLPFLFLLIATFALHLPLEHRMPLYFAMAVEVVNWLDYYVELPWDEDGHFWSLMPITLLALAVMVVSWLSRMNNGVGKPPAEIGGSPVLRSGANDRLFYKMELSLLKIIPMLIAGMYMADTVLFCLDVSMALPSFFFGTSLLPLLFIYLSSFVFQFCEWHRIFIYYVFVINMLNYLSLYSAFCFDNDKMIAVHLIVAGACLFLALFLYVKSHQKTTPTTT